MFCGTTLQGMVGGGAIALIAGNMMFFGSICGCYYCCSKEAK